VYVVALLAAAIGGWILAGWFGGGVKWMYILVATCAAAVTVWGIVMILINITGTVPIRAYMTMAAGAAVLLILYMPRTRHYFHLLRNQHQVSQ